MSFAKGTQVSIDGTNEQTIETFKAGDPVYAAVYNNTAQWSQQAIYGASPLHVQPDMMVISYQLPTGPMEIKVTGTQPFLLSTKAIKQAFQLSKHDFLVTPTGDSVKILEIIQETVGVPHDIVVSNNGAYWIMAAGVVCGDAIIQR